jgi:hypothetical protein
MGFQHKTRMRSYQFLSSNQGLLRRSVWRNHCKKRRIPELGWKLTPHSEVTVEKVYLERTYFVLFDPF